jgi:predicted nucleic acid-binding protein
VSKQKHLLDVNIVIALSDSDHLHHAKVMNWFNTPGLDWGLCAFSEAGFPRVSANSTVDKLTIEQPASLLASLATHSGYRFWPISTGWSALAAPFRERIFGHLQVIDAYFLGLAVTKNGVLVTLDKAIRFMAGPQYSKKVLVLE